MPKSSTLKDNSIVIHPTSNYLRIGRSTDSEPIIIPHCIARKSKNGNISKQSIISDNILSTSMNGKFNNSIKLASIAMKSSSIQQLQSFKEQPTVQELNLTNKENFRLKVALDLEYISVDYNDEFYVGEEACRIPPHLPYNLFWPFWGEKLSDCYSSSAVIQDLEDIWTTIIEKKLKIPRDEFNNFNIILVISDLIIRREIRWLVNMLLVNMQINSVILQQENVCVTYSTGLPTACVVSIHESSISISCIEEGISIPEGRIKLLYGTGDILSLFHTLLIRIGLPRDLIDDYTDYESIKLLQTLYNNSCDNLLSPKTKTILLHGSRRIFESNSSAQMQTFELNIATEHLIAGLSLFHPTLICKEGSKYQLQHNQAEESEPDDPFDDLYLSLTSRDRKKPRTDEIGGGTTSAAVVNENIGNDELMLDDEERRRDTKATRISNLIQESPGSSSKMQPESNGRALSLHDAIVKCIQRSLGSSLISPDDVMETGRQLCNIILAGGGNNTRRFPGFESWLRHSLQEGGLAQCGEVDVIHANNNNNTNSNIFNHDSTTAWRGACMITMASSADDVIISGKDWRKYGSRCIREKAPFLW